MAEGTPTDDAGAFANDLEARRRSLLSALAEGGTAQANAWMAADAAVAQRQKEAIGQALEATQQRVGSAPGLNEALQNEIVGPSRERRSSIASSQAQAASDMAQLRAGYEGLLSTIGTVAPMAAERERQLLDLQMRARASAGGGGRGGGGGGGGGGGLSGLSDTEIKTVLQGRGARSQQEALAAGQQQIAGLQQVMTNATQRARSGEQRIRRTQSAMVDQRRGTVGGVGAAQANATRRAQTPTAGASNYFAQQQRVNQQRAAARSNALTTQAERMPSGEFGGERYRDTTRQAEAMRQASTAQRPQSVVDAALAAVRRSGVSGSRPGVVPQTNADLIANVLRLVRGAGEWGGGASEVARTAAQIEEIQRGYDQMAALPSDDFARRAGIEALLAGELDPTWSEDRLYGLFMPESPAEMDRRILSQAQNELALAGIPLREFDQQVTAGRQDAILGTYGSPSVYGGSSFLSDLEQQVQGEQQRAVRADAEAFAAQALAQPDAPTPEELFADLAAIYAGQGIDGDLLNIIASYSARFNGFQQ